MDAGFLIHFFARGGGLEGQGLGQVGGIPRIPSRQYDQTSSAGRATLRDTSCARLTTELMICLEIRGDTTHSDLGHLVRYSN